MSSRMPVVIAGTNCLSGVTTWAERLRDALVDHPRYDVQLLHIGPDEVDDFDIHAPTVNAAQKMVRTLAPLVLVPNYLWDLFMAGFDPRIHCIGMCHADSDEQYYRPLNWYEPTISQFIAVSRECTERLTQTIPFRSREIATLPYGVVVPSLLRREYQTDPLRLVYAGRVTQLQKRVCDFVPLVDQLLKTEVPFLFDIVGEGSHFASLQDEMSGRFPTACIRFQPRIPHQEMSSVWSSHDVFLQVSDFEGTSVSMLEAMAHGVVPVVTAASSGIDGVIQHGKNGFVVPVGDVTGMAQILARLADDEVLLNSAGSAAHQTAKAYSMDLYCEKFVQVLDQVVQAGKRIDLRRRYGRHSPAHPLLQQRKIIVRQREQISDLQRNQQEQISDLQGGTVQRFLDQYRRLLPSKMRRLVTK